MYVGSAAQARRAWAALVAGGAVLCLAPARAPAQGQDLGHKLPGGAGLDAGRAPEPGLYVVDRFATFSADKVRDRDGQEIPIPSLNLRIFSNALAISGAIALPPLRARLAATVSVPLARISLDTDRPEASVDRFGVGDVFIQPLKIGWRARLAEAAISYALYWPTGWYAPRRGSPVSFGHFTHEVAAGGSLLRGGDGGPFAAAVVSYDHNGTKRGIDIKRGATLQVQGGAGVALLEGGLELGVAGYGLWQVRDDSGAALPPPLRGARDRAYGLGPEAAVAWPRLRAHFRVRALWDVTARARPQGRMIIALIGFSAWQPER